MTDNEITNFLQSLKLTHYINDEDCWYSCPMSGECCDDNKKGCYCGADDHNKRIDEFIDKLQNSGELL